MTFLFVCTTIFAQIPFPHNANNSSGAERVSNFGVSGVNNQRFEITNATVNNGQFLPALWAHNGSTNYHAIQFHATTTNSFDNGNSPLMMFIASKPSTVNLNAPSGTQFPWGNGGTQQTINNRPTFSWINGSSSVMLLSAQNNLGLSTSSPTARLDVNGTARVRNLPTTTTDSYILTSDTNGNIRRQLKSTVGGGGNDIDWLKVGGGNPTSINDNIYTNGRVGIDITNPQETLHLNGSIRGNIGTGALRVKSSSGYLDLGSQNSSWAHIYTDRPGIIFNKPVYEVGGQFSSYSNSNLFMQTAGITRITALRSNGNVGISTTTPTAKLHTVGTVRFQNLPNGKRPTYLLGTDSSGNVMEYSPSVIGGGVNCNFPNFLIKSSGFGSTTCSQIYDNGINVGIGTTSPGNKLTVNGNIQSLSNTFLSDKKYKKNIKTINNALESVLELSGTTYDWRRDEYKEIEFSDKKQYGLIAQEVEKVIPEIVNISENNEYSLNYIGLIPVLIEAIKEQQNQIVTLNKKISNLTLKNVASEYVLGNSKTYFSSNYPNPFEIETRIDFFIEQNVKDAKIVVYNSKGSIIKKYDIKERNVKTNLVISKRNLNSGIYFYTLITDNIVVGTKKMIVK